MSAHRSRMIRSRLTMLATPVLGFLASLPVMAQQAPAADDRGAAEAALSNDTILLRYYDDIGCAMRHMTEDKELAAGTLYVRPHGGDLWVKAEEARFGSGFQTPMNSGFGAVTTGGTLSFADLKRSMP